MLYVITGSFIVLDILSGLLKAYKRKELNSSLMREGLYHKMAFILMIALAFLCDYGQQFVDIGFSIPITKGVCVYVIVTEIGSNIENISSINPKIVPATLRAFFVKAK